MGLRMRDSSRVPAAVVLVQVSVFAPYTKRQDAVVYFHVPSVPAAPATQGVRVHVGSGNGCTAGRHLTQNTARPRRPRWYAAAASARRRTALQPGEESQINLLKHGGVSRGQEDKHFPPLVRWIALRRTRTVVRPRQPLVLHFFGEQSRRRRCAHPSAP